MIKFNNQTLDAEMVLGDTGTFSLTPKLDGNTYLTTGDTVYFTVKPRKKVVDPATGNLVPAEPITPLSKSITEFENGTVTIPINSSDTSNLDAGTYIYDIQVVRGDGTVDTLTPNGQAYFTLKKGVK
ncbi:MAG: hypothetical protein IJI98_10955 [Methanosphaera sp.]|nr:hypothetical protein [Methanobrevibacter sp.]MBQ6754185.1 hypothetical protein [Bacteroidales bacterium]MBR0351311.1 hypothetical protein [Clostridia bacterium]MBR0473197.1 hypothetical protein [Methanosphaera sp.]